MDGFPDLNAAKVAAASSTAATPIDTKQHDDVVSATLPLMPITQIPPRPWAYGRFLLFGSAAVLGAVDGGGKGAIAVVMMLAVITGKPLLGETVWKPGPVAIITYEDDATEWHRRIAAACKHYKLDYERVLGNVRFFHRTGGRITFGRHGENGIEFPSSAGILKELSVFSPALMIVDPFNHAHSLEDGNSNALIARVAGEMTRIAQAAACAVLVLHHLRKGSNGSPDDLMGATALRATFRSCRILARMAPEVAEKMKITDPWRYIRVAGSKENYAPPSERGTWYRLVSVALDNGAGIYPYGDDVAVAAPWTPRGLFEGMDGATLAAVFAALRDGVWGPNRQAKHTPWAGNALIELGGRSAREASKIITDWVINGVLVKGSYYHLPSKHEVQQVTLNDVKAAEIITEIGAIDAPAD